MDILGISAFYHDSAAALIRNGEIIAAAQEERFSRKKHDFRFPHSAIQYCLKEGQIQPADLDYVAFYDKPFLKFERILESYLQFAPIGIRSFIKSMPLWIKKKLWIKSLIQEELGDYEGKILFPEHHQSHSASAFYPSPFNEAAIITADGVGEWATTSIGYGQGNRIKTLKEIHFPHSLGLLYSAFTYYTGFKVNSGEYKVMGLAPFGEPKYIQKILDNLIDIKEDGSFRLNMDYFNYVAGLTMTNKKFNDLFGGEPRKPETKLTRREMDLARSVQEVAEMVMFKIAEYSREITNSNYLCLAGGVALNCVANGKILKKRIFDDIWIQPAAGDAGGALGAALAAWYDYLNNERHVDYKADSQKCSYLGPDFDNNEISEFLDKHNIPYTKLNDDELLTVTARLLSEEHVLAWFQGRMEFGPRALGSRSKLGDPRKVKMLRKINLKVKFREPFRPLAPSVLAEQAPDYFDIDRPSPYMLLVTNIRDDKKKELTEEEKELKGTKRLLARRSNIPVVTHVDYSARLHTVNRKCNEKYWKLINTFKDITGCPLVVNTSFNVRGEPIVCTPLDAYKCFMRTNIDYLVMGNFLLDKKKQDESYAGIDWKEKFELD
ncbi:carbamoyltransferase [bacterium]|nr:carbamoyltransferase [bacterium]